MRIVALLAVRNEERYMERCLAHLHAQGIETCVIDNGSTDRTLDIARGFQNRGVFRIVDFPYNGVYEWRKILELKVQLAREIDADWFIHHDADEIREAPKPFANLVEGIKDADEKGYNAINSDEFVFLPTSNDESFEGKDYVKEMKYYYFFSPSDFHRVNIWKNTGAEVDLASSGGHSVMFENRRIYPVNFILRHYILLSKQHAIEKYGQRKFNPEELARGWHGERARLKPEKIRFPDRMDLKLITVEGEWDRSDPKRRHLFL